MNYKRIKRQYKINRLNGIKRKNKIKVLYKKRKRRSAKQAAQA